MSTCGLASPLSFTTPVLLIAWRRPQTTKQVIDAIREAAPTQMFVSCDGPNVDRPGEAEKVAATRALIEKEIDWPCQIERQYADVNQGGAKIAVSRAITWLFQHVEKGIILEDDCVPHPDFFPFCATLLEHYRQDERIWCINGNNFQEGQWRGDGTYYFSRYPHSWGWASWRRCWEHFDGDLDQWTPLKNSGLLDHVFEDPLARQYWSSIWNRLLEEGLPDTWDFQWLFTCLTQSGLSLTPNTNLVSNVGLGVDATNCTISMEATAFGTASILPIRHPTFLLQDKTADRFTFDHVFGGLTMRQSQRLRSRLKALTRRAIRKVMPSTNH